MAGQAKEEEVVCKDIDQEVKRFLRFQKFISFFKDFSHILNPKSGMIKIWRTVRSLASNSNMFNTGVITDAITYSVSNLNGFFQSYW